MNNPFPPSENTSRQIIALPDQTVVPLEDLDFGPAAEDEVVVPHTALLRLKWLNGAVTLEGHTTTGMHIEQGVYRDLDELLEGMGMKPLIVEHRNADQHGDTQKTHWRIHPCSLIVVAEGVLSPQQMLRNDRRTGIAYGKETLYDDAGQMRYYDDGNIMTRKVLKIRVFVHELVRHGFHDWLPLTLSGFIADEMLLALASHIEILSAYEHIQGRKAPFYGFSLPLVPGQRRMVGSKTKSPIYPMVAALPSQIDRAFLEAHAVPRWLVELIRESLPDTIRWSYEESKRISQLRPTSVATQPKVPSDPPPASTPVPTLSPSRPVQPPIHPLPPPRTSPSLVGPAEIRWITQHYAQNESEVVRQILQYFGAEKLESLSMSQFQTLQQNFRDAKQEAEAKNQGRQPS